MVSESGSQLRESVGIELDQRAGGHGVELAPARRQDRRLGHVLRERVLEDVDALLGPRALVEKLVPDQFLKMRLAGSRLPRWRRGDGPGIRDPGRTRSAATRFGPSASRSMRALRTPCTVSGTVSVAAAAPASPMARASSSRKNGFPSALSRMSRARGSASAVSGRTDRTTVRLSSEVRRARDSCVVYDLSSQAGRYPGRYVVSSMIAAPARLSTSEARNSSDVRSIQWRSSMAMTRGRRRLSRSTICRSVSKVRVLIASGPSPARRPAAGSEESLRPSR